MHSILLLTYALFCAGLLRLHIELRLAVISTILLPHTILKTSFVSMTAEEIIANSYHSFVPAGHDILARIISQLAPNTHTSFHLSIAGKNSVSKSSPVRFFDLFLDRPDLRPVA
jgi:hypothetical protein